MHVVIFGTSNRIQVVPVASGDNRPSLQEVIAKTAVQLARQEGSASWFALIKGPSNIKTGLLASVMRSSDPIVAALPQLRSLFDQYSDVFTEQREPAPGQVICYINLLDESSVPPR